MFKSLVGAVSGAAFLMLCAPAAQAMYQTTLTFEPQLPQNGVLSISVLWDTAETSGIVSKGELTELSFVLELAGGDYVDQAIVAGVVQPIAGVARTLDDLDFLFSLNAWLLDPTNSGALAGFDNDALVRQMPDAAGVSFNIFVNTDAAFGLTAVYVVGFVDGAFVSEGGGETGEPLRCVSCDEGVPTAYSTVVLPTAVPVPAALPLLGAALGALGLAARRSRANRPT